MELHLPGLLGAPRTITVKGGVAVGLRPMPLPSPAPPAQ